MPTPDLARKRKEDASKIKSMLLRYLRTLAPYLNKDTGFLYVVDPRIRPLCGLQDVYVEDLFNQIAPNTSLSLDRSDSHYDIRKKVLEGLLDLLNEIEAEDIIY